MAMNKCLHFLFFFTLILQSGFSMGFESGPLYTINDFKVSRDVEWASPDGFSLTMDIYTPEGEKDKYPVLIIFHGGGWLANDKSIMDDMSQYVVRNGEYVVCNVNYRLLKDLQNTVTMDQIVEDAFGALLWVREHISQYGGDPDRIAVSGDSAGGHLAAMVVNAGTHLSRSGLKEGEKGFNPTYIPEGKDLEQIRNMGWMEVQAAVLNYAALDIYTLAQKGYEDQNNMFWQGAGVEPRGIFGDDYNVEDHPDLYRAVSPVHTVPNASERKLPPQLLTIGTEDDLISPSQIKEYKNLLEKSGQPVEYWEHKGRPHAFLDSGKNERLGISFEKDAPEALDRIIAFLDEVF
jgi:acetyl esterase